MSAHRLAFPFAGHLRPVVAALIRLPAKSLALAELARSRHSLRRLDDHLLRDIGLTRAEALAEANRQRWDAPAHWKG